MAKLAMEKNASVNWFQVTFQLKLVSIYSTTINEIMYLSM